ncbi:MAG TPA: YtxH domain-containing protein [Candidatus Kapabacteria bacterium]|jgi:gas vesicle protein
MIRTNGKYHPEDDYSRYDDRDRSNRSNNSSSDSSSKFLPFALGALFGAVVGATVALLYAPSEGRELRQGMSDTLENIVGGAKDIVSGVKTTAEKLFHEGLDDSDASEEEEMVERTRSRADDIIENADRAIAEARRRSSGMHDAGEE